MLDELLKAKDILPEQYDVYVLFEASELGRKVLKSMIDHYFMEEPADMDYKGEGFAYYSGRQSVLREIRRTISFIQKKIKEHEDGQGRSD